MRVRGEVRISAFLAIAIVEHLIFILALAVAAYTKPVLKPDDTPITVDILTNKPEQKRIEEEIPIAARLRRAQIPDELPPIHSIHNVQRYLNPTASTGGLPNLPLARTTNQNPDRLSLGAVPSEVRNQALVDDLEATNATVREKPLADQAGHHGTLGRRGVPDVGKRQQPRGKRGYNLTGNVSTASVINTGKSRVTSGVGFEFEISGEVSGRGYHLGKLIQTKGKQGGGVQLSFKVRPDGTVYEVRIKPGSRTTVGEVRLKEQARRYVERIRFHDLPRNVPQVDQSGEIFINFTTQLGQ
jgi:hypothetical protein